MAINRSGGMSVSLNNIISRGTARASCVNEMQAVRLFNSSVVSTVIISAIFSFVFYTLSLEAASLLYAISAVFFVLSYFGAMVIERELLSLINSCFISLINVAAFTYYGSSYGFQYIFLISIIVAIINTKNKKYRMIFYGVLMVYVVGAGLVLHHYGAQVPPSPYGNTINIGLISFAIMVAYQFMENFLSLEKSLKQNQEIRLEALEKKNEEFKTFNYTVAHDLKEPLRSISSFSELLYKNTASKKLLESENYNLYISKGVTRIGKLLDDLMLYIESTDKTILLEDVDLNQSLTIALENLSVLIDEKDAIISKGDLPIIRANASQTVLLFQNFLSNSIKFMEPDVYPEIVISCKDLEDGSYIFIEDNGIGISQDDQDKIFDAFRRLNGRGKFAGSGLGLTLCKKIVDSFSGQIEISSAPGNGTTFRIFIPAEFIV